MLSSFAIFASAVSAAAHLLNLKQFLNRGCIEEDGFYFQDREVRDSEDS